MESSLVLKKAKKNQVKLKIAISGISNSGKTYSALTLASGMGKKIILIDTENGSASLYANRFNFDVIELTPPYSVERYMEAIKIAEDENPDVLIIDSISHEWSGEGGLLQLKESLDQRGGNSFQNWAKITPKHEKFIAKILHSPLHIICTMRSKTEYIMEQNDKGKMAPKKVGLAPVQRDNVEYEFSIVFDIAKNHEAAISKDRTEIFKDEIFTITEDTGKKIIAWANDGLPYEQKKTIKDSILEKSILILDQDLKNKITETVINETDLSKMGKYLNRVEEILSQQSSANANI